jgi:hypothetical protein
MNAHRAASCSPRLLTHAPSLRDPEAGGQDDPTLAHRGGLARSAVWSVCSSTRPRGGTNCEATDSHAGAGAEIARALEVSETRITVWQRRIAGMTPPRRLPEVERKNARLNATVADKDLAVRALNESLRKPREPARRRRAVTMLRDRLGVRERCACRVVGRRRSRELGALRLILGQGSETTTYARRDGVLLAAGPHRLDHPHHALVLVRVRTRSTATAIACWRHRRNARRAAVAAPLSESE